MPDDIPAEPGALTPAPPAEPLAPWFGGKKYLAKTIAARIGAIPHTCYAVIFYELDHRLNGRSSSAWAK